MKKIVGIIAALSLVAGVAFADAPAYPAGSVAAFSGDASIEYQIDLDNEAFGIVNAENANFKIQFYNGGDKATEGDGLWGELKISVAAGDAETKNSDGGDKSGAFTMKKPSVDTAKIHFVDDDFYASMNIKAPGLEIGGGDILTASWSAKAFPKASISLFDYNDATGAIKTEKYHEKMVEKERNASKKAGFTLNFGLKDLVDFNLQFADNGVHKSKYKKFGFAFDATLKAVENLNLYAGIGYGTQAEKFIAVAKADYKLGLTDTLFIKPAAGFALNEAQDKTLSAGLLFGWGETGKAANFAKFNGTRTTPTYKNNDTAIDKKVGDSDSWDNVCNSCADGVSVFANVPIKENAEIELLISAFDSSLVEGLKIGAQFWIPNVSKFNDGWVADAAIAYASGDLLGDWKLSANFGLEAQKTADVKTGFLWGCGIENGAIIDNTTLYVNYAGQTAKDIHKWDGSIQGIDQKGTVKIGAKIHF